MKTLLIVLAILAMTFTASAILTLVFSNYEDLENRSSDIIVARCITNPPTRIHLGYDPDINNFSIKTIAVLKGTNFSGSIPLVTEQWLNQGDDYLIFGNPRNGTCRAIEDFRVIPLGREFYAGQITNALAGKSPDQEMKILFKRAIEHLDRQMKKEQQEKERLEEDLQK